MKLSKEQAEGLKRFAAKTVCKPIRKDCTRCDHCQYIGDGAYFCDEHNEIVLENYNEPTGEYMCCGGKDYEKCDAQ